MKYNLLYDYAEGCHPDILDALARNNFEQTIAYGEDKFSLAAKSLIRERIGQDAAIYFVSGGTQANIIIMSHVLRRHEAIIAAQSGHIVRHETGAMEAVGHRVITCLSTDGKLTPDAIEAAIAANNFAPHMAKPRLVYISNATEMGTVYTKAELAALSEYCRANDLLLMVDGARLAVALESSASDLTWADIAALTDIFWIGGTKAGTLMGEAIVFPSPELGENLPYIIKQRGGLLAKGRVIGQQFQILFEKGLFESGASHANHMARLLSEAFVKAGYDLAAPTQINQVFPILPLTLVERLEQDFEFYRWAEHDDGHITLRITTSWATDKTQIERFVKIVESFS